MFIVSVVPIGKNILKEALTYFSAKEIPLGSIVSVPIRSKTIDGIVISVEDASNIKGDVKDASFQIKKVEKVKGKAPYQESFFRACQRMQAYHATGLGAVVDAMLPSLFLEKYDALRKPKAINVEQKDSNTLCEKLIFQALPEDRLSWYRTLVREAFAKKQSVYVCVPTEYDIDTYYNAFAKGIEHYVFRFHSNINKKELIANYNKAISEEHAVIIIGTGIFLSIPRPDIRTIIVEHESSSAYKSIKRPFIDMRSFAEVLAEESGARIIFGDTLLRPETLYRHDQKELTEVAPPIFRLPAPERQLIVDMREKDGEEKKEFSVLSDTTKSMIAYALKNNENVFLFTVRKGLAGITVCSDCGKVMLCKDCNVPMVLYKKRKTKDRNTTEERIFMCNKCGHTEDSRARCLECNSWNLVALGIGIDKVREEVEAIATGASIVQIDKESIESTKDLVLAEKEINTNKGVILIGTEMAFSSIRTEFTHTVVVSLDGLLSIPSFNINQKILHIIERLSGITKRNMIIQTRLEDPKILTQILSGNALSIFRNDLKDRQTFRYPPFARLVKITFIGSARDSEKARSYLEKIFAQYDPQIFSAFASQHKGEYVTNTVLKIDPQIWPFPPKPHTASTNPHTLDLYEKLVSLPPSFSINIDPEDLL